MYVDDNINPHRDEENKKHKHNTNIFLSFKTAS